MSEVNRPRDGGLTGGGDLREIPSIERLRQRPALRALEDRYGHDAIVEALRAEAGLLRERLRAADTPLDSVGPPDVAEYLEQRAERRLRGLFAGSLHRVINATGVVVHTNLGRAPLSNAAAARLASVAFGYSNLEFDLRTGRRGRRDVHAAELLTRLTGAQAAVVVNNNAAATLLILTALASGREVVISRGELVEIGGGFRVPDVMAQSGAVLREVGTTNKTRVADYRAALGDRTALILRVHRSNFRIEGFTEQPSLAELVELGRLASVPVVEDLGSGWLGAEAIKGGGTGIRAAEGRDATAPGCEGRDRERQGLPDPLPNEPTVGASVAAGVDLVCFSGDKLLGGPQAGIIVGGAALVDRCRTHPLMRALRVDKLTYAALEATLLDYLAGRGPEEIPVVGMLTMSCAAIEKRARAVIALAGASERFDTDIVDGVSMVGGGSAPGVPLPTRLLVLRPRRGNAVALEADLRGGTPPVIARVEEECVLLDLRTVRPAEDDLLGNALRAAGLAG